jgi:hypothetical protein
MFSFEVRISLLRDKFIAILMKKISTFFSACAFFQFLVITTMDSWIRIGIQSAVADPDSMNPKHWNLDQKNEAADLQTS